MKYRVSERRRRCTEEWSGKKERAKAEGVSMAEEVKEDDFVMAERRESVQLYIRLKKSYKKKRRESK